MYRRILCSHLILSLILVTIFRTWITNFLIVRLEGETPSRGQRDRRISLPCIFSMGTYEIVNTVYETPLDIEKVIFGMTIAARVCGKM